jgi:hypothetical protein
MTEETAIRQDIATALLGLSALAETEPAKAYRLLKRLGLCLADLQETGFPKTDLKHLRRGWREVQQRIEAQYGKPPEA